MGKFLSRKFLFCLLGTAINIVVAMLDLPMEIKALIFKISVSGLGGFVVVEGVKDIVHEIKD